MTDFIVALRCSYRLLLLFGLFIVYNVNADEPPECTNYINNSPICHFFRQQSEFQLIIVAKSLNLSMLEMLLSIDNSVSNQRLETMVITDKRGNFARDIFPRFDQLVFVRAENIKQNEIYIKRNNQLVLHRRLTTMTDYRAFTNTILTLVTIDSTVR